MWTTLRMLGIVCAIGAVVCLWLGLVGDSDLLSLVPVLAFVGIVFLALASILDRVIRIETRLAAGTDRIGTNVGDFEKLGNVEGEATCIGCKRTAPKSGLYYHKGLDVYYHPECLTRDRSL